EAVARHRDRHHQAPRQDVPVPVGRVGADVPPGCRPPRRCRARGPDAGRPGAGQTRARAAAGGPGVMGPRTTSADDNRAFAGEPALIEWGDVVAPALPADFLHVDIEFGDGDDDRGLRVRAVGPSWSPRMTAMGQAVERWTI